MAQTSALLYLYVETPLHAGVGFVPDAPVDLPIQRQETTGHPIVRSSSLKGAFRSLARQPGGAEEEIVVFGPKPESLEQQRTAGEEGEKDGGKIKGAETDARDGKDHTPDDFVGALILEDAHILLFPVRSLVGVYTWVSSAEVFARFQRASRRAGLSFQLPQVPAPPDGTAWVAPNSRVVTDQGQLVLEEFTFKTREQRAMAYVGRWLGETGFPQDESFNYWIKKLETDLVILPEDAFRFFVTTRTEVTHRIRLDPETGAAVEGALWTEEYLPVDSLLYARIGARPPVTPVEGLRSDADVLAWLRARINGQAQVGGGRTLGRGILRLRWSEEAEA